jgi:hypothetical protein
MGTDHCDIFQVQDAAALSEFAMGRKWTPSSPSAKWSGLMLSAAAVSAYAAATTSSGFSDLQAWGDTTLGMVTGNNKYFALSPARVEELGLMPNDVIRLSPPGSRHLRGLSFTHGSHSALGHSGAATWLFRPADDPSPGARKYIEEGEASGVHLAYKCRVRNPWWRVPYLRPADLFLTYMNADTPRITTNRARAHYLNSVHGIFLRAEHRNTGAQLLPLASLNSMTLLGAETVGRAYGGGMLKLEPREADVLPVPSVELVSEHRTELLALRRPVSDHLRAGRLLDAVRLVDDVLLVRGLALGVREIDAVREAREEMTRRRAARGKEVAPRG